MIKGETKGKKIPLVYDFSVVVDNNILFQNLLNSEYSNSCFIKKLHSNNSKVHFIIEYRITDH